MYLLVGSGRPHLRRLTYREVSYPWRRPLRTSHIKSPGILPNGCVCFFRGPPHGATFVLLLVSLHRQQGGTKSKKDEPPFLGFLGCLPMVRQVSVRLAPLTRIKSAPSSPGGHGLGARSTLAGPWALGLIARRICEIPCAL